MWGYTMMNVTQRQIVLIVAWIMIATGAVLLFGPRSWFPEFYAPKFMGIGAIAFAVIIILPPKIFRARTHEELRAVQYLQAALLICLSMSGLGELGLWQLYRVGFEYDKLVHFLAPLILTLASVYFFYWWYKKTFVRAVLIAAVGVFLLGAAWEGIEFYSDKLFGTQLFGVYGQQLSKDTILDLIYNAAGVAAGILVLYKGKERWF